MNDSLISIINLFFIPFVSLIVSSKINKGSEKKIFNIVSEYVIYTIVVFALSKVIIELITDYDYPLSGLIYSIVALSFSVLMPIVFEIIKTRFDIHLEIERNEK